MFEASRRFLFFDYFRIPYREAGESPSDTLRGFASIRWMGNGAQRTLYWPADQNGAARDSLPPASYRLDSIPFHAATVPDRTAQAVLASLGTPWRPTDPIFDGRGRRVSSVWRDDHGSIFLPFDPDEAIRNYWSEGYGRNGGGPARLAGAARNSYYRLRPLLPRSAQIWFRRRWSSVQARSRFPRWPVEPALHDLYDFLLRAVAEVAGEPVPWVAWWPAGRSWAMVLTHDVEQEEGLRNLASLRDVERSAGRLSSWNFVPRRYVVADALINELVDEGCEVGVHGLHHDGRDFASRSVFEDRLPEIRSYAERWGAVGFRAPSMHRVWDWMPKLGFDYDSSYPDTDPFEPQPGGCCSLLPFFIDDLVELPLTLPQDHTLYVILSATDERLWIEKTEEIRRRNGMALINVHPDYIFAGGTLEAFRRYLEFFDDDDEVWHALPREVSAWWRRRAQSSIRRDGNGWELVGPAAAEGSIAFASPE
jgi:hypothetical protein